MSRESKQGSRHLIGLTAALVVVWLLWSGHYTGLLLSLGALSCVLVVFLSWRLRIVDEEGQPLSWGLVRPVLYFPWLALEVVKANIDVTMRILGLREIAPAMARIPAPQRTRLGQVIYADSITLTPGTVSIELGDDEILVHAISPQGIEDLRGGEMARRVMMLEGKA